MEDGVVVHITPTITNVLGFPRDMWIGRSFIDFVHPKDRMAFASHITCGLSFPVEDPNLNSQGTMDMRMCGVQFVV
jgi:period circadian protein